MKKQEFFMGDLNSKNYFEGWYFKQVLSKDKSIAFIPGISIVNGEKEAFIQIIETISNKTYYIRYSFEEVELGKSSFYIKMGKNYFSKDKVSLDIENEMISLKCEFSFKNFIVLKKTLYRPNIMGPFAYLKNMQCNHGIISLYHKVSGFLKINDNFLRIRHGIGYIEKDYGKSFPKEYIWLQSNTSMKNKKVSIMFSYAHIPFLFKHFNGFLCVFSLENVQYYFTTYYLSKVVINKLTDDKREIILKNRKYTLKIIVHKKDDNQLLAPTTYGMKKNMRESLLSDAYVVLLEKDKIIYEDFFFSLGYEEVYDI